MPSSSVSNGQHDQHRSEQLLLHDLGVLRRTHDEGRRVEGPRRQRTPGDHASPYDRRARGDRALDVAVDGLPLAHRHQGALVGGGIGRVAQAHGVHECRHLLDERLEVRALDICPGRRRAVLAGVDQGTGDRAVGCGVEVGVVEHHERGLATELEVHTLDRPRGQLHHALSDRRGAGERDHRDVRVADQGLADDSTRSGEDVDDPGRDACGQCVLGDHQRGERGDLGGLEDDRVPRRDGGQDLPHGHLQRVVPGGDRADDADRLAADRGGVRPVVLGLRHAVEDPGSTGEEPDVVDGAGDVELACQLDRLAGLGGLGARVLVGAGLHPVSEGKQGCRALPRRRARPAGVRPPRGRDGGVHIGHRRLTQRGDDRSIRGVEDLDAPAAARHMATVDELAKKCHDILHQSAHTPRGSTSTLFVQVPRPI